MNDNRKRDAKGRTRLLPVERERVDDLPEANDRATHVVFDFTGLHTPEVTDLALILTARLRSPENVWVRALDARTARVLRGLGLDHLFRHYPASDVLN